MSLRGLLIRQLVDMEMKNFKVVDSCCTTSCTPTATQLHASLNCERSWRGTVYTSQLRVTKIWQGDAQPASHHWWWARQKSPSKALTFGDGSRALSAWNALHCIMRTAREGTMHAGKARIMAVGDRSCVAALCRAAFIPIEDVCYIKLCILAIGLLVKIKWYRKRFWMWQTAVW